jgi:sarcosine oxidase subunit gamma
LAQFPVDTASRTVLGKIEVIVWRLSEDMFRVECWRSFSDYAFTFLADAARGNVA